MALVWPGDAPDPSAVRTADGWVAHATQSGPWSVQVLASADLRTWRHLGEGLPVLPAWAAPGRTWSPAALVRGASTVLYVAVAHRGTGRQAVAACVGDGPAGPFRDALGVPLVHQVSRGGSIDPQPFVDADGRAYLLWKSDDNALGRRSSLWVRELAYDGLSFRGRTVRLLRHELVWERPLVEAPALVRAGGAYHLLYSAGDWQTGGYALGHAVAPRVTGPYRVTTQDGPWLAGPDGPGGASVVDGPGGVPWLLWHAWRGGVGYARGGARALHAAPLDLTGPRPRLAE